MGDQHAHGAGDGHGHDPNQAHHFDTMDQQIEACKMGMWLFLATEVLLFAGLFCAYTVYRGNHPEVFHHASLFLDTKLGALNTVILLLSSFTAAWAVRAAQLRQIAKLKLLLVLTLAGAVGFLVVKYVEYSAKFEHGLLWGLRYDPHDDGHHPAPKPAGAPGLVLAGATTQEYAVATPWDDLTAVQDKSLVKPAGNEVAVQAVDGRVVPEEGAPPRKPWVGSAEQVRNVHIFFGIYFVMTGLHGLHVLIGMGAIGWVLLRAAKGDFDGGYYLPVDLVALYWHLVDLIWIYLFPLLYLIG